MSQKKVFNSLVRLARFDSGLGRHKSSGRYGPAVPYFAGEYRREHSRVLTILVRRFGGRAVRTQLRRAERLGWSIPEPE